MKRLPAFLSVIFMLAVGKAPADDIEIYFNRGAQGHPYVHLMLDPGPALGHAFCTMDSPVVSPQAAQPALPVPMDSPPCSEIMSAVAFAHLQDLPADLAYAGGAAVDFLGVFKAVISSVLGRSEFDDVYLSIITSNTERVVDSRGGGTILEGYQRLAGSRSDLIATIKSLPVDFKTIQAFQPKETVFEWWRYINGGAVALGTSTAGNYGAASPVPDYDASIIDGDKYISPFKDAEECPRLFSIMVAMNPDSGDEDLNTAIAADTGSVLAVQRGFWNMLNWLHADDTDLVPFLSESVSLQKSWIIGDSNSNPRIAQWLDNTDIGAGRVLSPVDGLQLETGLIDAFRDVVSVSSTLAAVSVPVNVFNRARVVDNVFVSLFEAQGNLDWPGNIKKLKLMGDPDGTGTVFKAIVDASMPPGKGFEATGDDKGRIRFNALTFWTDAEELPVTDNPDIPPGADGRVVRRGGAGQKIPGVIQNSPHYPYIIGDGNGDTGDGSKIARRIYVEAASIIASDDNLDDFSTALASDTAVQVLLGTPGDANEAEKLIKWGRGQDVAKNSAGARSWVLADAIHSRPFALNYGDTDGPGSGYDQETNPDIKLLFGTGDGMFHVVENTDSWGDESGAEVFGFYPRALLAVLKLRREKAGMSEGSDMRYGVDGAPVVFTLDGDGDGNLKHGTDSKDEVTVYFGLRRGGYSYYALDIIDPQNPKLKWKISQTRTDGGSSDFDELGLTFSTPVVSKVRYSESATDVLIFGGGYHGGWDPNDPAATAQIGKDVIVSDDPYGNAIYIVDARDGSLIWKATGGAAGATNTEYQHGDMVDSIPSKVTVLENGQGVAHRIYVGDTGGAVWRVDLPPLDESVGEENNDRASRWRVSRLADLTPNEEDLRFFHAPDVVQASSADNMPFDGVIIQSGNRADPLDQRFSTVNNYLFYLKDYETVSGSDSATPDLVDASTPRYAMSDLADRTGCAVEISGACESLNEAGWKIQFKNVGEKGLSTPLVDSGRVFSSTYRPDVTTSCSTPAEGKGSLYVVNLYDGSSVGQQRSYELGPGIPAEPVLMGDLIWLPGGGLSGDWDGNGVTDGILTPSLTDRLIPIYWREPGIDDL